MIAYPEFKGGVKSPEKYFDGTGMDDRRVLENPEWTPFISDGEPMDEAGFRSYLTRLDDMQLDYSWQYGKGVCPSVRIPYNERLFDVYVRDGIAHVRWIDDYRPSVLPDCFVTTFTEVTEAAYLDYMAELENSGLQRIYSMQIEKNSFDEFSDGKSLLRCNRTGDVLRIIEDEVSLPLSEISDSCAEGKTEIYQYSLHYTRNRGGFSMDCGMCYLAKLPNGSVLMVDGGYYCQCTEEATEALMDLLHRLGGEKIRLVWFCTHGHSDHVDMLSKIIRLHHDEIELERVLFNFPSEKYYGKNIYATILFNRIKAYYPEVRFRKLHAGDVFNLGGCPVQVLLTHEQLTGKTGDEHSGDYNDTSTVLKMRLDPSVTNGDADFLLLGDMGSKAEAAVLDAYSAETLHSGAVQVAHHLINRLDRIYDTIDADIALVPQSERAKENWDRTNYLIVTRTVAEDAFYFANQGTDGFQVCDGRIVPFFHEEKTGGVYDGSLL